MTDGLSEWGIAGGAWIRGRVCVGDRVEVDGSGVRRPMVGTGEVGLDPLGSSRGVGLGVLDRLKNDRAEELLA